jgi:CopG family transcriptional regulator, nickel-responsive regulator
MIERFSISLEPALLKEFDLYVKRHDYATRSEAARDLLRKALVEEEWSDGKVEVMGVISIVYEHHRRGLMSRLMSIQHDFEQLIVSSSHVHVDHDNCLEVMIVRGVSGKVHKVRDAIAAIKGVKYANLSAVTTGERIY